MMNLVWATVPLTVWETYCHGSCDGLLILPDAAVPEVFEDERFRLRPDSVGRIDHV